MKTEDKEIKCSSLDSLWEFRVHVFFSKEYRNIISEENLHAQFQKIII
jgi:hypothetical protein